MSAGCTTIDLLLLYCESFNIQLLIYYYCKIFGYLDKLINVTLLPFTNGVTITNYHRYDNLQWLLTAMQWLRINLQTWSNSEMEKPIEECGIQNEDGGKENGREEQEGRIRRNVRCRVSRNTRFVNIFVKNYYHIHVLNIYVCRKQHKTFSRWRGPPCKVEVL